MDFYESLDEQEKAIFDALDRSRGTELVLLVMKQGKRMTMPIDKVEAVTILKKVEGRYKKTPLMTVMADGTISQAKTTADWTREYNEGRFNL